MAKGKYKARAKNKSDSEQAAQIAELKQKVESLSAQLTQERAYHELARRDHNAKVLEARKVRVFNNPIVVRGQTMELTDVMTIMEALQPGITDVVIWAAGRSGLTSPTCAILVKNLGRQYKKLSSKLLLESVRATKGDTHV